MPLMKIWKAVQNVENGVVWGGQGLLKVIGNVTSQQSAHDFLFNFNEKLCIYLVLFSRYSELFVEIRWP